MKLKTVRRWLNRNSYKIANAKIQESKNSLTRRATKLQKLLQKGE